MISWAMRSLSGSVRIRRVTRVRSVVESGAGADPAARLWAWAPAGVITVNTRMLRNA